MVKQNWPHHKYFLSQSSKRKGGKEKQTNNPHHTLSTKVNSNLFHILKDHSFCNILVHLYSSLPSPNKTVLLQNYKLMYESMLYHVQYSQEKILQRFTFPVKAGKASESIHILKILDWNRKALQTIFLSEVLLRLISKQELKLSFLYG